MELNQFRDVDLVIDKANDNFIQRQFVSQGDYRGRTMTVQVTDNGLIGQVPGLMLNLRWQNQASGLADLSAFECIDAENSVFRIEYPEQMMTPGKVIANIQVIQDGKVTHLKSFELTVQNLAGEMTGIVGKAEYGALVAILADANKFRTDIDTLETKKADKTSLAKTDAEVAVARGVFNTLDERLTTKEQEVKAQLAHIVTNVKDFGAKGDGITDDTVSIQNAIDDVSTKGGGRVLIPNGTYMIKANSDETTSFNYLRDEGGIALKDNIHLILDEKAILKAIPTSQVQYIIVRIYNKRNVTVEGGTIEGERDSHLGTTGEWGCGISIQGGENIALKDTNTIKCWGDGINIQAVSGVSPKNVTIERVKSDHNRRQGMSIEALINGVVRDSEFAHTKGTWPSAGVDIEPLNSTNIVKNLTFDNCCFIENDAAGLMIMKEGVSHIKVLNCTFEDNTDSESQFKTYSGANNILVENSLFNQKTTTINNGIRFQNGFNLFARNNMLNNANISLKTPGGGTLDNVVIEGNKINYTISNSLVEQISVNSFMNNVKIINNIFEYPTIEALGYMSLLGKNIIVTGNMIKNVQQGISVSGEHVLLDNNVFVNVSKNLGAMSGKNNVFTNNRVYGSNYSSEAFLDIFRMTGSNNVFTGNSFYKEADKHIYQTTGYPRWCLEVTSTAVNNVVQNNMSYGVDIIGGTGSTSESIANNFSFNEV